MIDDAGAGTALERLVKETANLRAARVSFRLAVERAIDVIDEAPFVSQRRRWKDAFEGVASVLDASWTEAISEPLCAIYRKLDEGPD